MSETPTGWQPIETAPRDRSVILLWDDHDKVVVSGQWDVDEDDRGYWSAYGHYQMMACRKPTHWMPPPAGPAAGEDAMSETKRSTPDNSGSMLAAVVWDSDGGWVRYTDHQAEMERLTSERDEAQAEVERLWRDLTAADGTIDGLRTELAQQDQDLKTAREDVLRLMTERNTARAEVERLAEESEGRRVANYRVMTERDAALNEVERLRAEVERLTSERDTARAEVQRLIAERDQMATRPMGREVGRFGLDGHYLDYEALKPTRPSDEDIWREAFMTMLPSYPWEKAAAHADSVLAEYRKRWPR